MITDIKVLDIFITLLRTEHRKRFRLEASVATLGPLHPFECEERRSETILITVQTNTKEHIKNRPSYGAS